MRRNMIDPLLQVKLMPRQVTPASLVFNRELLFHRSFPDSVAKRQRKIGGSQNTCARIARALMFRDARAGLAFGR
jgi:hypothetical protein